MQQKFTASLFLVDKRLLHSLCHVVERCHPCSNAAQLWLAVLKQQYGKDHQWGTAGATRQDTSMQNASELMQTLPQTLPTWFLASKELEGKLSVKGLSQVVIHHPSSSECLHMGYQQQQLKHQQYQHLLALHTSGRKAVAAKAGQAFLLQWPPLPVGLLKIIGTADMLALSLVCKDLRVASYELLRREDAAMAGVHELRFHGKSPSKNPFDHSSCSTSCPASSNSSYVPLSLTEALPAMTDAVASATTADDEMTDVDMHETQQATKKRKVAYSHATLPSSKLLEELTARRHMRCLSLLAGTPEAAAMILAQRNREEVQTCSRIGSRFNGFGGGVERGSISMFQTTNTSMSYLHTTDVITSMLTYLEQFSCVALVSGGPYVFESPWFNIAMDKSIMSSHLFVAAPYGWMEGSNLRTVRKYMQTFQSPAAIAAQFCGPDAAQEQVMLATNVVAKSVQWVGDMAALASDYDCALCMLSVVTDGMV